MNDEIITLPLGFRFVVGNDVVEVQKARPSCTVCFFFNGSCNSLTHNIACTESLRSDGRDVIFVKVGEVKP